jgi:predicted ester cyclase
MSNKRVVGKKAFSSFVQQMREAYPDLHYEVGQVRCCVIILLLFLLILSCRTTL